MVERSGYLEMRRSQVPLAHIVNERIVFLAGFDELIVETLIRLGYQVEDLGRDVDSRLRPLTNPRSLVGLMAGPIDLTFLKLVGTRERGLVRYNSQQVSIARLISQFALTYPTARIVCAVTRTGESFSLRRGLRRWIKNEPVLAINHLQRPNERARIVVGTYTCLGGGEADLHNRDVVFSLHPIEMCDHTCGKYTVRNADTSRIFGFLSTDQKLTSSERDRCTALFGSHEVVIPRHGQVERPVQALFLPIRGPAVEQTGSIWESLRTGVWQYPVRNRRIARLADALAIGNAATLKSITTDAQALEVLGQYCGKSRVGILCGTIEHALDLCGRLRGWRLVTGQTARIAGLSAEATELLRYARRQPNRPGKGFIVTEAGLSRFRRCDVIIRADAGIAGIPTHWTQNTNIGVIVPPSPALVVDFVDRYDRALLQRSRQRRVTYLADGWRLSAEFSLMLDQFLATRLGLNKK